MFIHIHIHIDFAALEPYMETHPSFFQPSYFLTADIFSWIDNK